MFLFVLLVCCGGCLATTSSIQQNFTARGKVFKYKLLLTLYCKDRELIRSRTCQKNEHTWKSYVDFCRFAEMCEPGLKPICVNSDEGEMLHICSQKDLVCQKGYRRRVWLQDPDSDVVLVQEEKCPLGSYQSYESNCYHACAKRHADIKEIPIKYKIYSLGDNILPTYIYCDYENGFYNMDGKFLINYDEQNVYPRYYCTSVLDHNLCDGGQYPLPNATCVQPCKYGFQREVHDDFKCKAQNGAGMVSRSEDDSFYDNELHHTTDKATAGQERDVIHKHNPSTKTH